MICCRCAHWKRKHHETGYCWLWMTFVMADETWSCWEKRAC